jgi:hypothetical protein
MSPSPPPFFLNHTTTFSRSHDIQVIHSCRSHPYQRKCFPEDKSVEEESNESLMIISTAKKATKNENGMTNGG